MTYGARRSGSVRFSAYFKVQVWRTDVGGAWVDIQKAWTTVEDARDAGGQLAPDVRWRIVTVTMDGRAFGPEQRACV